MKEHRAIVAGYGGPPRTIVIRKEHVSPWRRLWGPPVPRSHMAEKLRRAFGAKPDRHSPSRKQR